MSADLDALLVRADEAGVKHLLCCGSTEADWCAVEKIGGAYPNVISAFGIHPWYAHQISGVWLETLRTILVRHPCAAIGEIGLDHAIDNRNDKQQHELFCAQLCLAMELKRAVSIHCRKAWHALLAALDATNFKGRGAIHSFGGSIEVAKELIDRGFALSFSGSLTNEKCRRVRAVAEWIGPAMMLVESDAPDGVLVSLRSKINEPANVRLVVTALAEIKHMPVEAVARITYENAKNVFMVSE